MSAPHRNTLYTDITAGTQISATRMGVATIAAINTTGAVIWVQVFNVLLANIILGTTVPMFSFPLAANNGFDTLDFGPQSLDFDTGLTLAATTTATGGTPAGAGVHAQVFIH